VHALDLSPTSAISTLFSVSDCSKGTSNLPFPLRGLPHPLLPVHVKDAHEYFEIGHILDASRGEHRIQSLIKWKRYPDSDNSCERPADNPALSRIPSSQSWISSPNSCPSLSWAALISDCYGISEAVLLLVLRFWFVSVLSFICVCFVWDSEIFESAFVSYFIAICSKFDKTFFNEIPDLCS